MYLIHMYLAYSIYGHGYFAFIAMLVLHRDYTRTCDCLRL
jgi:hypothetical protein